MHLSRPIVTKWNLPIRSYSPVVLQDMRPPETRVVKDRAIFSVHHKKDMVKSSGFTIMSKLYKSGNAPAYLSGSDLVQTRNCTCTYPRTNQAPYVLSDTAEV